MDELTTVSDSKKAFSIIPTSKLVILKNTKHNVLIHKNIEIIPNNISNFLDKT